MADGFVTVSKSAREEERGRAERLARRFGLSFVKPVQASGRTLVVEREGVRLVTEAGTIGSHPGMGLVRLRRLLRGEEHDPLITLSGAAPGDRVLDATFGFGQDALLFAHAVGSGGRVVAFESSPLLVALAVDGMPHWPSPARELTVRIDLRLGDSRAFLFETLERSFDVVYFDPMFREPRSAAPDFPVLRALANPAPLDRDLLSRARKVARRVVVVKDAWPGRELEKLNVPVRHLRRRAEIVYGVIEV